ncbi:hypothetical protein [Parerythrobacter aestuarii]|uniref:hypothetical protein n=1 Tax=Parerythrobacter aestuarii TaxID=3020909 RepID=UPI0024DEC9A5|nr:hypothetical protein [Parerythrobacter aestuarii]
MKKSLIAGALAAAVCLTGGAAQAKAPKERFCSFIHQTEDGKFRHESKLGWSLFSAQAEPGEISYPASVVGVTCLRDPILLVPEDAESLRLGLKLYLADPKSGQTVKYEAVDGKVVHNASAAVLGRSLMKKLEKAIAQVEALL